MLRENWGKQGREQMASTAHTSKMPEERRFVAAEALLLWRYERVIAILAPHK